MHNINNILRNLGYMQQGQEVDFPMLWYCCKCCIDKLCEHLMLVHILEVRWQYSEHFL
jgi:hypothetical protein